jgi:hypothetical protein
MDALIALLLKLDANSANALAAFLALVVSAISVGITIWAVKSQRLHNELSVRPLAEISVGDYEESLRVKLRNQGIGPMIVKAVTVSDGANVKPSLVDWMPDLPNGRPWTDFTEEIRDRALAPGSEIVLLELTEEKEEAEFAACRDMVREALSRLTVNVEYTNVYNTVMPPRRRELSWFGRHLED